MPGEALSPAWRWSPDGRFVVFSHIDPKIACSWRHQDRSKQQGADDSLSGNVVIEGPAFTPDNKVAVALSKGRYPANLSSQPCFQGKSASWKHNSITTSPQPLTRQSTKMAFTSSRLGGPQIFLKDLSKAAPFPPGESGEEHIRKPTFAGRHLVVFSRMTEYGRQRIFVQDMLTGIEEANHLRPRQRRAAVILRRQLFYSLQFHQGGGHHIYLTTRHGGDAKQVPTGGRQCFLPALGRHAWRG